ncbi:predicted protein [Verticillium alfalfae VaMs.102]|uniref:Predicted protein n=1 Tax=Verticillium alfalfae (strain VaMs.102 / ATCC MYA-4576 / FGSC 10136) TaxID=526221 RepID=C9SZ86_VERA1|nr:predicted protein [Verticillium alfalfae VaMs.102]EEY24101.1 predicted protein [Verticillium alfalfae VaMs.102]
MQKVQGPPHQVALPPPYDKIPPAFQTNVVISDIRDDSQKEAEYRENFADYLVFRFEKLNDPGDVDEGGNRRKPNWEKATRTRVEMSKEAAAGEVFRLKHKHRQLWEKKHALEPAQRLHLDQTLQLLQEVPPQDQRPRLLRTVEEEARENNRKREQLSITAFYKRLLRPELNAIDMMMIQQNLPTQRPHASEATMFLPQGLYARQQAHAQAQRGPPGTRIHPQALAQPQHQRIEKRTETQAQRQAPPLGPGQGQARDQGQQSNAPPGPPVAQHGGVQQQSPHNGPSTKVSPQTQSQFVQAGQRHQQGVAQKKPNNSVNMRDSSGHRASGTDHRCRPAANHSRSPSTSSSFSSSSSEGSRYTPTSSSLSGVSRHTGRGRQRNRSRGRRSRTRSQSPNRKRHSHQHRETPEDYGIGASRSHHRQERQYLSDTVAQGVASISHSTQPPSHGPSQAAIRLATDEAYRAGMARGRASARALEGRAVDGVGYAHRVIGASGRRPDVIRSGVRLVEPRDITRRRTMEEELDRLNQLRIENDMRLDGSFELRNGPHFDERVQYDRRQHFDGEAAFVRDVECGELRRQLTPEQQLWPQQEADYDIMAPVVESERMRQGRVPPGPVKSVGANISRSLGTQGPFPYGNAAYDG